MRVRRGLPVLSIELTECRAFTGFVSPRDAELAMVSYLSTLLLLPLMIVQGRGVDNKQRPPKSTASAEVEMTAA